MKILFVHLLNNYTGAPRVLSNLISSLNRQKYEITVLTSNTKGAISDINYVNYKWNKYSWKRNKIFLIINFLLSQMYQFLYVLFFNDSEIVYINTILPFGAAIAAKFRRKKIIYHVHEYYQNPNIMQKICIYTVTKTADKIIFVSNYLKNCYMNSFSNINDYVVYNSVSDFFHNKAFKFGFDEQIIKNRFQARTILMPASLKKYKGIKEFIEISRKMPNYNFLLVLSGNKDEVIDFLHSESMPLNLKILSEIKDMTKLYENSSLVINLSHVTNPDIWIETFAMTLIEGFEYGIPVIGPNKGGPTELIKNEWNGYLINPFELETIIKIINNIFNSIEVYKMLSNNAKKSSEDFNPYKFVKKIENILEDM